MKRYMKFGGAMAIGLAIAVSYLQVEQDQKELAERASQPSVSEQSSVASRALLPSPDTDLNALPATAAAPEMIGDSHVVENQEWFKQAVKLQLKDVATAYENNIRFPTYSKPLSDKDWNLLNPRAFVPKAVPLDFNEDIQVAVYLDHYIINKGQSTQVSVEIQGDTQLEEIRSVDVVIDDAQALQISLPRPDEATAGAVFSKTIDAAELIPLEAGEKVITASLQMKNGDNALVSTVFKLAETDATLSRIGQAYVDDVHLVIPVEFDLNLRGYYRVQANLFDKESGKPVSHINTQFMLTKDNPKGELKVHAVTLKATNSAGPYLIKDFNITRSPSFPGDKTGYGVSAFEQAEIPGFELASYADEEYVDEDNQRRLEFLQKLANSDLGG